MAGIENSGKLFLVFAFDLFSGEYYPGIFGEGSAERCFYFEGMVDELIIADAFVFD